MDQFVIPQEVVERADRCSWGHACVDCQGCSAHALCPVDRLLNDQLSFLVASEPAVCSYCIDFADSRICMCPARAYIFKHYGK